MIKAIQTQYKGCNFRSRLEARWAVFFDALGVEWDYEPEGFELPDGTRYLPDFWLPKYRVWIEIKGQEATPEEKAKCFLMAQHTSCPCFLIVGPPRLKDYGENCHVTMFTGWRSAHIGRLSCFAEFVYESKFDEDRGLPNILRESGYWPDEVDEGFFEHHWERNEALCRADAKYFSNKYGRRDDRYDHGLTVELRAIYIEEDGALKIELFDRLDMSIGAVNAARSARFEYGQSGATA